MARLDWRTVPEEVAVQRITTYLVVLTLIAVVGFATACSQPTPEEKLAQSRARYEASVNGFVVEQQPMALPEPEAEATEEAEDGEAGDEAEGEEPSTEADGEEPGEAAEVEELPTTLVQNVLLDIVIRHESFEKLDGVTVDITMADGDEELEVWRVWFDTSAIEKGPGAQFAHTLENVDYQPGYGFSAEVRYPIPPEERHLYREFADLGS